jgi:hypothetical protein
LHSGQFGNRHLKDKGDQGIPVLFLNEYVLPDHQASQSQFQPQWMRSKLLQNITKTQPPAIYQANTSHQLPTWHLIFACVKRLLQALCELNFSYEFRLYVRL